GLLELAVGQPAARELVGRQAAAAAVTQGALAILFDPVGEGDEMVVPANHLAGRVDAAAQEVEAARAEVVVLQVVLAGPGQLDRRLVPHALGDGGGLDDEVRAQAPAEAAAA